MEHTGTETIDRWDDLRLDLARDEYHIELEKSGAFGRAAGTLLAILGGATILRQGATTLSSWAIHVAVLALVILYVEFVLTSQNRVDLQKYIFENPTNPDELGWRQNLIETYSDAVKEMRCRRNIAQVLVGLATAALVVVNLIQ